MNYKISIVVPFYNTSKLIENNYNSLKNQKERNFEVVYVDDGSTDDSFSKIQKLSESDENIRVIKSEHKGVSHARNVGLSNATGEYVLFIDADDTVECSLTEVLSKYIPNYDVIVYSYKTIKGEEVIINEALENYDNIQFKDLILNPDNKCLGYCWNKLIKRTCITSQFDESIAIMEDELFFLENMDNISSYVVINEPLYNYHINETSLLNKMDKNRITALKATINLMDYCDSNIKYRYMMNFCHLYPLLCMKLPEYKKEIKEDYYNTYKEYFKELLKSSEVDITSKIKLILKRYLRLYGHSK